MTGNSNDEANFTHKLLLTGSQVPRLHMAFANNSSANIELSKAQIFKMIQSGGFLGDLAIGLLDVAFRTGIEAAKRGT